MIRVVFARERGEITGFKMTGHAEAGAYGRDIICAAVSSAAYMAANTLTDVLRADVSVTAREGRFTLSLSSTGGEAARAVLRGLLLHLKGLSKQYPKNLRVIYGGKTPCLK